MTTKADNHVRSFDSPGLSGQASIMLSGAMLALAVVVMIALPVLTWRWAQNPFPAVLFGPSYIVSDITPPNRENTRLGLGSSSHLDAVDGVELNGSFDLERLMSGRQVGERVTLALTRPDGSRRQAVVALVRLGAVDWVIYVALPYLIGLVYVVTGVWVYRQRYKHSDGRAFGVFCAAVAILTASTFENSTLHILSWLWSACVPLAAGAIIGLTLVFPQEMAPAKRWPFLRWLPYVVGLGLALVALPSIYNVKEPWSYETSWRWSLAYLLAGIVFLYASVGYHRLRSPAPLVRQQTRVILWGSLAAFAPLLVELVLLMAPVVWPALPSLMLPAPIFLLPLALWPLALGYAILRYRLWDIDLLINRGLVYGTLTVLLAGAYFLLLAVLTPAFVWLTGQADNATVIFVATATLALIFTPARGAVQAAIDRLFYRDRLDLRAAQGEISRALSTTLTLEHVVQLLTDDAPRRLRLERATVWLHSPDGLLPHPPESPVAVESAPLLVPLGKQDVYAIGMSLAGRPPNREEADLLTLLGNQASVALENVRLAKQLSDRARIEQEMRIARETQTSLLPTSAPQFPGWDIAGYSQPASEVGGDFYIYHPLTDGSLGISVGDVSGKGMSAALLMGGSVIALAALCLDDPTPADLLRRMDQVLQPYRGSTGRNTALCYVRLPASGSGPRAIRAANAGMIAPLVRRANGQVAWLDVRGLPLGAPRIETHYAEMSATLEPGDMIVIASDGIIERMNAAGELFGFERFEQMVAACPSHEKAEQICSLILEQVAAYAALRAPHDDMTLIVACVRE